jgi:hypothetical protein
MIAPAAGVRDTRLVNDLLVPLLHNTHITLGTYGAFIITGSSSVFTSSPWVSKASYLWSPGSLLSMLTLTGLTALLSEHAPRAMKEHEMKTVRRQVAKNLVGYTES